MRNPFSNDTEDLCENTVRASLLDVSPSTDVDNPSAQHQLTLSDLANNIATDPISTWISADELFTQTMIDEYMRFADKGNEGDVPFPPGFMRKLSFWKMVFFTGVIGVTTALAACAFLTFTDQIPKLWVSCDYNNDAECAQLYQGEAYYIALLTASGIVIGTLRWLSKYPFNLPGIFKEINSCHVDPSHSPYTYILSALSLGAGIPLGPEAALGNMGGGMGDWLTRRINFHGEDNNKLMVLSGMSAALGSLFPSPVLSAMMIHELGNPPKHYMESTLLFCIGASISFLMYYQLVDWDPYLRHVPSQVAQLALEWSHKGFSLSQCGAAFCIGLVSSVICLLSTILIGAFKMIFNRLRARLEFSNFLENVIPPAIGGFLIGLLAFVVPLSLTNGSLVLGAVVKYSYKGQYSNQLLITTAFTRIFTIAISMNCGFIGGFIFPMITIGVMAGCVCAQTYTSLPYGLCIGCFACGIPGGICPIPLTIVCLVAFIFHFGLEETAPLLIATVTSYSVCCGSGLMKKLQATGQLAQSDTEPHQPKVSLNQDQIEADEIAFNHYLQVSKRDPSTDSKY